MDAGMSGGRATVSGNQKRPFLSVGPTNGPECTQHEDSSMGTIAHRNKEYKRLVLDGSPFFFSDSIDIKTRKDVFIHLVHSHVEQVVDMGKSFGHGEVGDF